MASNPAMNTAAGGRDPQATIALLRRALERMPGNIDAMVGLAGQHLQLGLLDDAGDWCARALAVSPAHAPGHRVRAAIEDAYIKRCWHEVIDGRIGDAIDILSRAAALLDSKTARLYRDLFVLASTWLRDAAQVPVERGAIRLSLPVWGADYVAVAASGLLRSLLAPGNLPALAQSRSVRLEITTSARDRALLENAPILAAVRRHAEIDFFTYPDHLLEHPAPADFPYWLLSVAHHASAERARHAGARVSFLTADMIVADGSMLAAQSMIDDGILAVLVGALEVERDGFLAGDNGDGPLSLSPECFLRQALTNLNAPIRDNAAPLQMASSALFAIEGGLVLHAFHFLPLMVSSTLLEREFSYDLLTIDTRFVRLALGDLPPTGRIRIVTDADEIAIVSTNRASRDLPGPHDLDCNALGQWAAGWCFAPADAAYFDWCFKHRVVYRPAGTPPAPTERERSTVDSILTAYRQHAAVQLATRRH